MLLLDSSVENTWDATENMRLLCFNLTRAISINEPGVEKIVVFIHLYNFGLRTCPSMKVSLETTRMVLHHFPERLGHCILYRPPRVFGGFFRAILPFVDPVTRDKAPTCCDLSHSGSRSVSSTAVGMTVARTTCYCVRSSALIGRNGLVSTNPHNQGAPLVTITR